MNPCLSNPCKIGEDCIQSNDGTMSYVCENFCDRMKPCNNNSHCVYSRENNTFTCHCFNGASNCDSNKIETTYAPITASSTIMLQSTILVPKLVSNQEVDTYKTSHIDTKFQSSEIPKFGLNYENVISKIIYLNEFLFNNFVKYIFSFTCYCLLDW